MQPCLLNAQGSVLLPVVLQDRATALLWDPQGLRQSHPALSTHQSSCKLSNEIQLLP